MRTNEIRDGRRKGDAATLAVGGERVQGRCRRVRTRLVRLAVWRGTRTLIPLSAHCRRAAREKPTASSSQKKIQSRQREPGVTWVEPVRAAFPPESWSDRDDHLRSPEFFDAAQFPEIVFESTKIEALDDDDFRITGRLTIHGVSHEIVLDAEVGRHRAGPLGQRARRPRSHRPALTWRLRDEAPADARERQCGRRRQGHARARRIGHQTCLAATEVVRFGASRLAWCQLLRVRSCPSRSWRCLPRSGTSARPTVTCCIAPATDCTLHRPTRVAAERSGPWHGRDRAAFI